MKIRSIQQFLHQGAPVKVGEVVEMEDFAARSIIQQGSAVEVQEQDEPQPAAKPEAKRGSKTNE